LSRIVTTSDGSHTIYVPELDEHYHSIHGAVTESEHIFLNAGFDFCKADPVRIFEVGFGTGLNALLTANRALSGKRVVHYTSIEKYPLGEELYENLNYYHFAGGEGSELFRKILLAEWGVKIRINEWFYLTKIKGDLAHFKTDEAYELIYFDAFGPDKQPEMWSMKIFAGISRITEKGGILVTYSVKGDVKRNLRANGFEIFLLPGPPGKRQILRAIKI
jgi:tRNA U34 5-methylaminomethyl-2-thiouridine-forming methyltransferase MnmC